MQIQERENTNTDIMIKTLIEKGVFDNVEVARVADPEEAISAPELAENEQRKHHTIHILLHLTRYVHVHNARHLCKLCADHVPPLE